MRAVVVVEPVRGSDRPAAAAGLRGGLVERHARAAPRRRERRREPRDPGSDHVDPVRHHAVLIASVRSCRRSPAVRRRRPCRTAPAAGVEAVEDAAIALHHQDRRPEPRPVEVAQGAVGGREPVPRLRRKGLAGAGEARIGDERPRGPVLQSEAPSRDRGT